MPTYPAISEDMMKEFEREITGRLAVPENARRKTAENKKTGEMEEHVRFNESGQIDSIEVTTGISAAGDTHDIYQIQFAVTGTKGSGINVGGKTWMKARINPEALAAGNKDNGQYKMSRGTLIRLTQLVRAAGFPIQGGLSSAQMAAYFPENGKSPLIGKEVWMEVHQTSSEKSPTGWNEEVSNIFPLQRAAATTEV